MNKLEVRNASITDVYVSMVKDADGNDTGQIKAVYGRIAWGDGDTTNELRCSFEDVNPDVLRFWSGQQVPLVVTGWLQFRLWQAQGSRNANNLITCFGLQATIDQEALQNTVKLAKQFEAVKAS